VSGLPWPAEIGERVRRDSLTDEWTEREAELRRSPESATPGVAVLYGQSARFVDSVVSASEVVHRVCTEAEQLLRTRPSALLASTIA